VTTITVIVGEPPYGKQRVYTALRFVLAALHEGHAVNLFLLEDAIFVAKKGQAPQELPGLLDARMPNVEELLNAVIKQGAKVKICGTCAAERSLPRTEIVAGAEIATMVDLVHWVSTADRVVSF
jgi:tRNA 2-thiouridine synthesizing protein D